MRQRNGIGMAVTATLAAGAVARAGPQLSSAPDAAPPAVANPISALVNGVGVGDKLKPDAITAFGYVSGSWTYDASSPPGNIITGRVYDTKHESLQLDQVGLVLQRRVSYKKPFDVGFTLEQIYGWDSAYFHANGLTVAAPSRTAGQPSEIPRAGGTAAIHPKAQYDLTQANLVLSTDAVAKGLAVEVGKFDTLVGFEPLEAFNPNPALQGPFFSKSFIFTQEPFTQTGALAVLQPVENLTATAGITRGWNQATDDVNGSIDYTAQAVYAAGPLTATLTGITGDEEPSGIQDGWRTLLDTVEVFKVNDSLKFAVNGMYAWEAQTGNGGAGGGTGQWYALAAYASYQVVAPFTVNVRAEYFGDPDGAAPHRYGTGVMSSAYDRPIGTPNNYAELTLGATVRPLAGNAVFTNLTFRPEVRVDYADHATWDDGTGHYQFTVGLEGFYAF